MKSRILAVSLILAAALVAAAMLLAGTKRSNAVTASLFACAAGTLVAVLEPGRCSRRRN